MSITDPILDQITAALEPYGLVPRGGFVFDAENVAPSSINGLVPQSVVLVGHFGSSIWPHFMRWRQDHPGVQDPLDAWSKEVLTIVAVKLDAKAVFPSDKPYLPFQQWAMRAEGLRASPLGLLVHPEFGLWQAFRGALLFEHPIDFPDRNATDHPCDSCMEKPCLSACPVDAFDGASFAVDRCRGYLSTKDGKTCLHGGCLARLACPIGRNHVYVPDQQRFHMAAFARG